MVRVPGRAVLQLRVPWKCHDRGHGAVYGALALQAQQNEEAIVSGAAGRALLCSRLQQGCGAVMTCFALCFAACAEERRGCFPDQQVQHLSTRSRKMRRAARSSRSRTRPLTRVSDHWCTRNFPSVGMRAMAAWLSDCLILSAEP